MDRKVPGEQEKKKPTKKKSSSGCHSPAFLKPWVSAQMWVAKAL